MTVLWFGKTSKRRKEPAHAPGGPAAAAAAGEEHDHHHHNLDRPSSAQNSNPPPGRRYHHAPSHSQPALPPRPSSSSSAFGAQQPQLELPYRPGGPYALPPPGSSPHLEAYQPPADAHHGAAGYHHYQHPSQTTLTLIETQPSPPTVMVSPPSADVSATDLSSQPASWSPAPPGGEAYPAPTPPPMYHTNARPAFYPPPHVSPDCAPYHQQYPPYYYPQDPNASQVSLAYQASPPPPPGQWGVQHHAPSPHAVHHWGPPPQPSPPVQQQQAIAVAAQAPSSASSPSSSPSPTPPAPPAAGAAAAAPNTSSTATSFNARVNGALRRPGQLASQSLSSLNESYRARKLQASQSVTNLNDGLQRRQQMASRSVSNLHDRTNQYMAHTVALCDLISTKLDQVITSIDDEVFSGNEQELVIYEHPPEPHQSSLDVSKGTNNPNLTAVASSSSNYFSKVWLYANSRLPPHLPPLKVYMPTWPLLCLAAQYSEKVYHKPPMTDGTSAAADADDESETHVEPDWRHGTKAMVIKSVPVDDMNTIVFAIRGSAGFMDWAVNFRPAPTSPKGFLDDDGNLVHSGFLYVARKMVAPVAARLRRLLERRASSAKNGTSQRTAASSCSLLITGHSAGGAVASLLYAHMMAESGAVQSDLNSLTRLFKRVHCVTFGAPPVSLLPLRKPEHRCADDEHRRKWKKSLFFAFINEGDPVVRADKDVIKNMLRLYATPAPSSSPSLSTSTSSFSSRKNSATGSGGGCAALSSVSNLTLAAAASSSSLLLPGSDGKKQKKKKTKSNSWSAPAASHQPPPQPTWNVPPGVLSCAGRLVLLRDRSTPSPASKAAAYGGNPLGETNVEACTVADEELRSAVFGDPMCHMMKLYARRIEVLATRAVTAGGMDLG